MSSPMVRVFLRRHVLGLMAIFMALSGTAIAAGDNPTASSSVVTTAKFKKLKQRVTALEGKVRSPATGDLQGTYPNLTIRDNAVTSGKIADAAVTAGKIAPGNVGAAALAPINLRPGTQVTGIATSSSNSAFANCNPGEQALGGGGQWDAFTASTPGLELSYVNASGPPVGTSINEGIGNQSGATRAYTAYAFCLAP